MGCGSYGILIHMDKWNELGWIGMVQVSVHTMRSIWIRSIHNFISQTINLQLGIQSNSKLLHNICFAQHDSRFKKYMILREFEDHDINTIGINQFILILPINMNIRWSRF